MRAHDVAVALIGVILASGCEKGGGSLEGSGSAAGSQPAGQATEGRQGAPAAGEEQAPVADTSAEPAPPPEAQPTQAAPPDAALVARGAYIVNTLVSCPDCHSPRDEHGMLIADQLLAGNPCLFDLVPPLDNGQGCLAVPNLTNHPTGIANRTEGSSSRSSSTADARTAPC